MMHILLIINNENCDYINKILNMSSQVIAVFIAKHYRNQHEIRSYELEPRAIFPTSDHQY